MLVNLKKRVKTKNGWTFQPVPRKNGRLFPEKVTAPGIFYIEWRQNGKRHQERASPNPRLSLDYLHTKQKELDAGGGAVANTDPKDGPTVEEACDQYTRHIKATKSLGTIRSYAALVNWFKKNTPKPHIGQLTRDDIMALFAKGREDGLEQVTVNKRIMIALGVIRNAGFDVKLNKGDWPRTTEPEVEVFEENELKKFFACCDERERILFSMFLYTGFRRMEVATLQWTGDVDWANNTLRVRPKPDLKFTPKTYESRNVRVPAALMEMLKAWNKKAKNNLVFPSKRHPNGKWGGRQVDGKLLEQCKEVAYKAGLNCGACATKQGKCSEGPHCNRWFLHKFRHTFATNMLRSGVDIKSLQMLLGHKSLATTEKYLKSLRLHDLEQKIENSTLAGLLT